jgi:hypothetical protein
MSISTGFCGEDALICCTVGQTLGRESYVSDVLSLSIRAYVAVAQLIRVVGTDVN